MTILLRDIDFLMSYYFGKKVTTLYIIRWIFLSNRSIGSFGHNYIVFSIVFSKSWKHNSEELNKQYSGIKVSEILQLLIWLLKNQMKIESFRLLSVNFKLGFVLGVKAWYYRGLAFNQIIDKNEGKNITKRTFSEFPCQSIVISNTGQKKSINWNLI